MALTVITAPNSLPTDQQDYVKQNNLLAAGFLDPDKIFKLDFTNNFILKGSVVNLGGTILRADSDEAISGTASKYVKLDVSAYTASYVTDLTGVSWNDTYNGYYDVTGNIYFFDELESIYNTDEVTIAHFESSRTFLNGVVNVLKISIIDFLVDITISGVSKLCGLDKNTVAISDGTSSLATYSSNEFIWELVGSTTITEVVTSIDKLNSTSIALVDTTNDVLGAYGFDGTNWSLTGSLLSIPNLSSGISSLNSTDVAVIRVDGSDRKLGMYRFNGSSWALVGAEIIAPATSVVRSKLNDTDVFISQSTTYSVYRFNGSIWTELFNGSFTFGYGEIKNIKENVLVLYNSDNDFFQILQYDGSSSFSQIDNSYNRGSGTISISRLVDNEFAEIETGADTLKKYRRIEL